MIRLVLMDVEGVITRPGGSQEPWPLEAILDVRRFFMRSPVVGALCTGRQAAYGQAVIQALDLFQPLPTSIRKNGFDLLGWPSILENGAYLYDPVVKRAIPHPLLGPEQISLLRRLRSEVLEPLVAETGAQLEPGKDFCVSVNPPLSGAGSERQNIESFFPVVEAALETFREAIELQYSASAVDITPLGVSKAAAVRLLLERLDLSPDEVVGIGDTRADESWLREVGWRAGPANAYPSLPDLDYYATREVTQGLLEILERLESRNYAGL